MPSPSPTNPKALVERGYDVCAAAYEQARQGEAPPELDLLTGRLPDGAPVLDIGCGAGVPIARALARRFSVTGVDISGEQIRRARANVPEGTFIRDDIMAVSFPPASFDAVVAFYSLFHLPREEHPELLRRIRAWLEPGGYLLATLSFHAEAAYTEDDFCGVTMYWSNHGLDDYKAILAEAGFTLVACTPIGGGLTAETSAPPERHPLILAGSAGETPQEGVSRRRAGAPPPWAVARLLFRPQRGQITLLAAGAEPLPYWVAVTPPSTKIFCPVISDEASEARNTASPTRSSVSAMRPKGMRATSGA